MSPAGVPGRLEVSVKRKSFRAVTGAELHVIDRLTSVLASGEVGALVRSIRLRQDHAVRIAPGSTANSKAKCGAATTAARHGFQGRACSPGEPSEQNVRLRRRGERHRDRSVVSKLGLTAHSGHYPGELSLGLARRVALARALRSSPISCSSTSVRLARRRARCTLRDELAELVSRRPVTTLLVTHNVEEAIGLADRLFLLSASPARMLAEVQVRAPRSRHSAGGGQGHPGRDRR